MSASAPIVEGCPDCSEALPRGARYCPACGSRLRAEAVPPLASPVAYERMPARWLGIGVPALSVAALALVLAASLVLFATGRWPWGLILVGISALLAAGLVELGRGKGASVRSRALTRERAQTAVEVWRARATAGAEARRARSALALAESERHALHRELGAAVHRRDVRGEAAARRRLDELDAREAELRERLGRVLVDTEERIRVARLPVQKTMMVLPVEPTPPPGEADPPQPATVPEPYPPPDEGDPPQPARVPEPSPGGPRPEEG